MPIVTLQQAREALDSMDDFARMNVGVDAYGPRSVLERFIAQVEAQALDSAQVQPSPATEGQPCQACLGHEPTGNSSAPRCAFASGVFSGDNWCCGTMSQLRELCYEGQAEMPAGVDYQYCSDQKYASIRVADVLGPDETPIGLTLWMSWYKNRGGTDALWLLSDDQPPRTPTEQEVLAVLAHYAKFKKS